MVGVASLFFHLGLRVTVCPLVSHCSQRFLFYTQAVRCCGSPQPCSNGRLPFVFYSAAWVVLETALAQAKTSLAHSEFYNRVGTVFRRPLSRKVRAFLARGFGASATRLGQAVVGH